MDDYPETKPVDTAEFLHDNRIGVIAKLKISKSTRDPNDVWMHAQVIISDIEEQRSINLSEFTYCPKEAQQYADMLTGIAHRMLDMASKAREQAANLNGTQLTLPGL